jgi:hypothetical protein
MGRACMGWLRCVQGFGRKRGGKRQLERCTHRWEDNIKKIFKEWVGETWTGLLWLRIGAGGKHLRMVLWPFAFRKMPLPPVCCLWLCTAIFSATLCN